MEKLKSYSEIAESKNDLELNNQDPTVKQIEHRTQKRCEPPSSHTNLSPQRCIIRSLAEIGIII